MTLETKYNIENSEDNPEFMEASEEIENFKNKKETELGIKRKAEDGDGKPDWKKVKKERKELKLKRKQNEGSDHSLYETGVKMKKVWEELRREDCNKTRKTELCKELYNLIKGKALSFIHAHDTVRVIETLLTAGGEEYRNLLFDELKGNIINLSKNKYSRFFVLKLLRCGTKEQKNAIMLSMKGQIVVMMSHKIACDVVELAYNDYANSSQRVFMMQEFYGPNFKYFKENVPNLQSALEKHPESKDLILKDIYESLEPIIEKGVYTNSMIHTLLKEFLYVCSDSHKENIIESIKEGLLPIMHTRDGARVVMLCLWNGTLKEKKVILKSFKGKFLKIALEEHGYKVLLAAFDTTDDTVFISKTILAELMANLNELIQNENGKKVLRYLVAPRNKIFFHPDIRSILEEGDKISNSKKDRSVKYKELQKVISKPVLKLIYDNIKSWAKDSHWTLFIGSALQSLYDEELTVQIFDSLVEICAEPFMLGDENHFLEAGYMSKMITFIIQCDKERFQEKKPLFISQLLEIPESEIRGWTLSNRGCFILVNLIETEIPVAKETVINICKSITGKLGKSKFSGAAVLLKKLE